MTNLVSFFSTDLPQQVNLDKESKRYMTHKSNRLAMLINKQCLLNIEPIYQKKIYIGCMYEKN